MRVKASSGRKTAVTHRRPQVHPACKQEAAPGLMSVSDRAHSDLQQRRLRETAHIPVGRKDAVVCRDRESPPLSREAKEASVCVCVHMCETSESKNRHARLLTVTRLLHDVCYYLLCSEIALLPDLNGL